MVKMILDGLIFCRFGNKTIITQPLDEVIILPPPALHLLIIAIHSHDVDHPSGKVATTAIELSSSITRGEWSKPWQVEHVIAAAYAVREQVEGNLFSIQQARGQSFSQIAPTAEGIVSRLCQSSMIGKETPM